jgi:uncharacterized protein (DUF302 family)
MYFFTKIIHTSFEEAIAKTTEALKKEGFGVLTEIDVKESFKKKIDKDFRPYRILGACHPLIAYEMLNTDDKAGVLYPCNVVVQQQENGDIEVSAIDPRAMFQSIDNPRAREIAENARQKMQAVIEQHLN